MSIPTAIKTKYSINIWSNMGVIVAAGLTLAVSMLNANLAYGQQQIGNTVFFDHTPTVEDLNRLFATKSRGPSIVRKIKLLDDEGPAAGGVRTDNSDKRTANVPDSIALLIQFDLDSARVLSEYEDRVAVVARFLQQNPQIRVEVQGHADAIGASRYNFVLSERRARAIKSQLEQRYSIAPERLQSQGYGEDRPMVGLDTSDARNRRVEFRFLQ